MYVNPSWSLEQLLVCVLGGLGVKFFKKSGALFSADNEDFCRNFFLSPSVEAT